MPQQTNAACDLSTPGKCTFPKLTAQKSDSYHLLNEVAMPHYADAAFNLSSPGKYTFPKLTAQKSDSYHLLNSVLEHISDALSSAFPMSPRPLGR